MLKNQFIINNLMNIITNFFDLIFRQFSFQFNFLISYFKIISYFKTISFRKIMLINNFDIKIAFTFNNNKQTTNDKRIVAIIDFIFFFTKKHNLSLIRRIKIKKINQKTRSISFVNFLI